MPVFEQVYIISVKVFLSTCLYMCQEYDDVATGQITLSNIGCVAFEFKVLGCQVETECPLIPRVPLVTPSSVTFTHLLTLTCV